MRERTPKFNAAIDRYLTDSERHLHDNGLDRLLSDIETTPHAAMVEEDGLYGEADADGHLDRSGLCAEWDAYIGRICGESVPF